jgi:uncharacterized protein YicC (UPF0701 family)
MYVHLLFTSAFLSFLSSSLFSEENSHIFFLLYHIVLTQKEEIENLINAAKDETYQFLIESKPLDPESEKMKKKLENFIHKIETDIAQLEEHLNIVLKQKKTEEKYVLHLLSYSPQHIFPFD